MRMKYSLPTVYDILRRAVLYPSELLAHCNFCSQFVKTKLPKRRVFYRKLALSSLAILCLFVEFLLS